eukprot:5494722-Pleurochrysis_carterae.AAC.1
MACVAISAEENKRSSRAASGSVRAPTNAHHRKVNHRKVTWGTMNEMHIIDHDVPHVDESGYGYTERGRLLK